MSRPVAKHTALHHLARKKSCPALENVVTKAPRSDSCKSIAGKAVGEGFEPPVPWGKPVFKTFDLLLDCSVTRRLDIGPIAMPNVADPPRRIECLRHTECVGYNDTHRALTVVEMCQK
jgi:hypothetical protein